MDALLRRRLHGLEILGGDGMRKFFGMVLMLAASLTLRGETTHPILAVGSQAPDFSLPGVDGKIHKLSDYASSPILVVVFTCNHCPIAQMYERRIEQLYEDYGKRGVAVVAIQGNDPNATTIDELDSSDLGDTLDDMKTRVQYKKLHYPYLYDGATQSVTRAYGPQATPHVFVFDKERHLRYEGRFDNSYRIEKVTTQDARNAVDDLLAGKPIAVTHTAVFGCSTKWQEKEALRAAYEQKLEAQPVNLDLVDAAGLKKLRANAGDHYTLVTFWATWCGSCVAEFSDLQDIFRMYSDRDVNLVTVSANMPDERQSVLKFLERKHATSRNLLFASDDTAALQAAFDPKWQSAVPYTVLLGPNGTVLYSSLGSVDILQLRRKILASVPSDYIGFNKYWTTP
ncbi:redoxin domain-containing protein [Acidisarcina polymorpha]|uniref:redoxin domain-containing protein n=1 Tax=Acidisarcina polymorpha TaxID=2211140 RepID=UPI001F1A099F|nr:redoxin domain-containing protein [Acidisarcina polymorpha]